MVRIGDHDPLQETSSLHDMVNSGKTLIMLKAVVFDFDGIIVDTEPLHYRAFQKILVPLGLGYSWEEYVARYMGFDDREAFREAFHVHGKEIDDNQLGLLISRKASLFQEIITEGIKPYPGVIQLLKSLSGEIPLALCSGALYSDILPILRQLDIHDTFSVMVAAEDVVVSKPDPASYALAVRKLAAAFPKDNISPEECLAVEDTPAGIASAGGAGMPVLAVTNSYPAEMLHGADFVVDSLEEVSLEKLREITK